MSSLEFPFTPAHGKMPTSVLHRLADAVSRMDGKRLVLTLKEQKRRRSLNQNRYMFGVVIKMITQAFREAGNSVDDEGVFAFMKAEVWKLRQVYVTPDGEVLYGPGSTRLWSTQEMEVRLEQARAWAAETLGVQIPLPNEVIELTEEGTT